MTGSPATGLPTAGDTGTDERNTPDQTTDLGAHHPLLRRPQHAPSGAGVKALRPLRGRATPSLDPDASPRRAHNTTKKTKTKTSTTHDRPHSFRDDLRKCTCPKSEGWRFGLAQAT